MLIVAGPASLGIADLSYANGEDNAFLSALPPAQLERIRDADVVVIGEVHPNQEHQSNHAALVRLIEPDAIVFEMIHSGKGGSFRNAAKGDPDQLRTMIEARVFGWTNLGDHLETLKAAPDAEIYGAAIPRSQTRAAVIEGAAQVFGASAGLYGLSEALPKWERELREELQMISHCNALPEDLLPGMVEAQRLLDATFARSVVLATARHRPVVLITGNGHARTDWGVPAVLRRVAPHLKVVSIIQREKGSGVVPGDITLETSVFDQGDPCASLRKE